MRAFVVGVERMFGHSKKTGRDYDMSRVYILEKNEGGKFDGREVVSGGYRVVETDATTEAVNAMVALKFPGHYEVTVDMQSRGGRLSPVVTGVLAEKGSA